MGIFAKVLVADGIAAIANVLTTSQFWRYAPTICAWSEICFLMDWSKVASKISITSELCVMDRGKDLRVTKWRRDILVWLRH